MTGTLLSQDTLRKISEFFNGDNPDLMPYKSGPRLVEFFNSNFGFKDSYGQGFPSRWYYTMDKLIELTNRKKLDDFFNLILSKRYLMVDMDVSDVDAVVLADRILTALNNYVKRDGFVLVKRAGKYVLVSEDDDLEFVGEGGFAIVYKRKSNSLIVKKLKEEFITQNGIKSRFKREYDITKSLDDLPGIIHVYDFNAEDYSYTMEFAEQTLYDYVSKFTHTYETQKNMIRQILHIMTQVHGRNILHRDISPNNILLLNGMIKISDFGLGKDLDMFHSHRTVYTNALGQFFYCAPEQFMQLKDGDKRSDVFSLGRLINFIMTGDPRDNNHLLRSVVEKATNENPLTRYIDAKELLENVERVILYHEDSNRQKVITEKIRNGIYDDDVDTYIYALNGTDLCREIVTNSWFINALIKFIQDDEKRSNEIFNLLEESFRDYCGLSFSSYDNIAELAYRILSSSGYSYTTKESAARILRSVAYDVNRFNAQRLIERLEETGLEPLIEDILVR